MRFCRTLLALTVALFMTIGTTVHADTEVRDSNRLSLQEKKELLTETAIEYNIPPEILKAIAMNESKMMQFNEDGTPIITEDNGIGIMQVTNYDGDVDHERLKYDTAYNIEIGAQILKEKWNLTGKRIPAINDQNSMILEHWYFPIMAYNGTAKRNDPAEVEEGKKTYQDEIYDIIEEMSLVSTIAPPSFDFNYNDEGQLKFPTLHYKWDDANTYSTQLFQEGDQAFVINTFTPDADGYFYDYGILRNALGGSTETKLPYYTQVDVISGPYIADGGNRDNLFVTYEVKGNGFSGYMASANLRSPMMMDTAFSTKEDLQPKDTVAPDKTWTISMNTEITEASVTPRNIYIVSDEGNGVRSDLIIGEDRETIEVNPYEDLKPGTYTLFIKDIESNQGLLMKDPIEMTFTVNES